MLRNHKPKGLRAIECVAALLGMSALLSHTTLADTVYRCSEAYSSSSQCANGTAKEVKPSAALHTTEHSQANAATRDLRDAQALEKQRLQAEQQAAQAAPVRLSTPSAVSATPGPSSATHNELSANKGNRRENGRGKHARKANNPYFTAVDPTAAPKKKSTAKAVPANSKP